MNIVELFPKRKRVVGWNTNTGMRTANSLNKEGRWQELEADIWACETSHQLVRCVFFWSAKVIDDKWPEEWVTQAKEEFDKAAKAIEALAAQQAE